MYLLYRGKSVIDWCYLTFQNKIYLLIVICSLSIIIVDLILLYGYADESVRPSVRHNSVNFMWHTGNQWSPPSNNFWTNPTPDRAQIYYVMYVSTWTAHSKWCDNCSLYMRSSSATVSWNECRWRSYWWQVVVFFAICNQVHVRYMSSSIDCLCRL